MSVWGLEEYLFSFPLNLHLFAGRARIVEGIQLNKNNSQPISNGNKLLLMWLEGLHLNIEGVYHKAWCFWEKASLKRQCWLFLFWVGSFIIYSLKREYMLSTQFLLSKSNSLLCSFFPSGFSLVSGSWK